MNKSKEALVVGCGFAGSVNARVLADHGWKVTVLERRDHIAGNAYDFFDEHGIPVHKYGPHTFHTDDDRLVNFIKRFSEWDDYHLKCGAQIKGKVSPTPFNFTSIDQFWQPDQAGVIKEKLLAAYPGRRKVTILELLESDIAEIKEFAQFLWEEDFRKYTAKQWGIDPKSIDPSVLKRVPVRLGYEEGYFDDRYQLMPRGLYADFFRNMLDHPLIEVVLAHDALNDLKTYAGKILFDGAVVEYPVIYSGPIDEFFGCQSGRLEYRSLRFEFKSEQKSFLNPYPVVAYPDDPQITRIVEFKHMYPALKSDFTAYEVEYPERYEKGRNEPYYPLLNAENLSLYELYRKKAERIENLFLCGRLAEFRYYNMDQILRRALDVANEIVKRYQF